MHMKHSLSSTGTCIENGPITVELLLVGDSLGLPQNIGENAGSPHSKSADILVMHLGNHEHMSRSLRIDIPKGNGSLSLAHNGRRNLPSNNFAEQTPVLRLSCHVYPS